jgi:hypothetical protein
MAPARAASPLYAARLRGHDAATQIYGRSNSDRACCMVARA